ncbi:MAG: hypothetical protein ACFFCL_14510, partial [Promethearchaeota archaeon]
MVEITQKENLLEKALTAENVYNWKEAARLYEQIAQFYVDKEDKKKAAEFYHKSSMSFLDAVYSSKNAGELEEHSKSMLRTLIEATNIYKNTDNLSDELECKGMLSLINAVYFMKSKQEVMSSARTSVEALNRAIELHDKDKSNKNDLARKLYIYTLATVFLVYYINDVRDVNETLQKGFDFAYKAWKLSKEVKNLRSLADSLSVEAFLWISVVSVIDFKKDNSWKENLKNFILRCDESQKILGECKNSQILGSLHFASGLAYLNFGFHFIEDEVEQRKYFDKCIKLLEKSVKYVRKSGNNFILIESLYYLNHLALFAGRINYLQKRISKDIDEITKKGIAFKNTNLPTNFVANYLPALYYSNVAKWSFFTVSHRKSYAKKGIEYAEKALEHSLCDVWNCTSHQAISWSYSQLISLTTIKEERRNFIQKMIKHANKAKEIAEKFEGGILQAIGFSSLYRTYRTLADIADNKQEKIKMLTIAIDASKNYVEHAMESRTGNISARLRLGLLHEEIGILTLNNDTLIQAKELFDKVFDDCINRRYYSYAAAACEYCARIEDRLGNYHVSADYYKRAKNAYLDSLKNVEYKLLKNRINEKVQYVYAWKFIENAKASHKKENHLKAKENYERAIEILKDLPNFNFESNYYSAWAAQEEAESLSKLEKHKEATEQYEKTKRLFHDSIKAMNEVSSKIKNEFITERIKKLEKVARLRIKYCSARSDVEKARVLGKQGEYSSAAELFASAASEFRDVCNLFKIERERGELEAVYYLCRAWESMELAEKYSDPERFAEASDLFIKASKLFSDSKLKLLASGNSAFCQALELGCEFDETFEYNLKAELYPKIRSILRKAASSYEKGGFENGSNWALATATYFDAAWSLIKA